MIGTTHATAGSAVGLAVVSVVGCSRGMPMEQGIMCVTAAIVGSLIPDIDHPGSLAGKKAKTASALVSATFGHRTFMHSPLLLIVFAVLIKRFCPAAYIVPAVAFLLGYLSHLFLDMLNPTGIPLLYPHPKKFHIASIRTGSGIDSMLRIAFAVVCVFLGYNIIAKAGDIFGA